MQEWLDATLADDFDAWNNGPIYWCRVRHVDASEPSKPDAGRNGSVLLGLILNEFQKICTVSVFWNCAPASRRIG